MDILHLIFVIGLHLSSAAAVSPVFMWPMNNNFLGYEVRTRTDACPKSGECFSVGGLGNPNLDEQSVIMFDGNSFIDFHINGSNLFNSFIFSYFIKPTESKSRSVLVHYKADVPDSSKISEFIFEGKGKDYVMTLIFGDGSKTVLSTKNDFRIGIVSLLSVWYRHNTGSLEMYSDFGHEHSTPTTKSVLNVPGKLRFGQHQTVPDIGYVGEMSCASMYDSEASVPSLDEQVTICNHHHSLPPAGSVCLDSGRSAALVWPLDDQVYAMEIKMNSSLIYPTIKPSNKHIEGPLDLANYGLRFNGAFQSAILTAIPLQFVQGDFTISMFLLLDVINSGTIVHIKGHATSGMDDLKLVIYNNELELSVFDGCKKVVVKHAVSHFQWQTIAFGKSEGNMYLIVDDQKWTMSTSCSVDACLMEPTGFLDMVIGNSINGGDTGEGFKGGLSCLSIFRSAQEPLEVNPALISACKAHGQHTTFTFGNNLQEVTRETRQIILHRDVSPPDVATSLSNLTMASLVTCGMTCVNTPYCKTYTYSGAGTCILYDVYIINQLEYTHGTNYYLAV